jgi:hypothetical protein
MPMERDMDATISREARRADGTALLLRHCLSVGTAENRVPARERLDQAVGAEFARRLVTSLLAHSRR